MAFPNENKATDGKDGLDVGYITLYSSAFLSSTLDTVTFDAAQDAHWLGHAFAWNMLYYNGTTGALYFMTVLEIKTLISDHLLFPASAEGATYKDGADLEWTQENITTLLGTTFGQALSTSTQDATWMIKAFNFIVASDQLGGVILKPVTAYANIGGVIKTLIGYINIGGVIKTLDSMTYGLDGGSGGAPYFMSCYEIKNLIMDKGYFPNHDATSGGKDGINN